MEVLVLAARDAVLLDDLRNIMHRAIQASDTSLDVVMTLENSSPEQFLGDNQLLLWRDCRSIHHVEALIQERVEATSPADSVQALNSSRSSGGSEAANNDVDAAAQLLKRIHKRDRKIKSLTAEVDCLKNQLQQALTRVKCVEDEQEQFFEDVQHMKDAYDKLHSSHQKLLWEYLPSRDPDMRAIPRLSRNMPEGGSVIGAYELADVLGFGQYATVYAAISPEAPDDPLAIKAIDKEKLIDLVTLHRVNSEIASLQDPLTRHPGILAMRDVIHTRRHIYLVTERGGKDLFDFFGPHNDGVPEDTIKALMLRVAMAVQALHQHNYCHRDLKPENILYAPEHPIPAQTVKIVDFGLCTKATSPDDNMLHDFCGSPGFFAPEILVKERYDGCKADMWSLGCILLELVVGNERFASMWMPMYELETLRNLTKFGELLQQSLAATREFCHSSYWSYSVTMRQLLLSLLCENPQERLSVSQMLDHLWFSDAVHPPSTTTPAAPRTKPPLQSPSSFTEGVPSSSSPAQTEQVPRRPVSAKSEPPYGSPHVSVLASAAGSPPWDPPTPSPSKSAVLSSSNHKVSLPSISPEKPVGMRSPDKSFAKRNPSVSSSTHSSNHAS